MAPSDVLTGGAFVTRGQEAGMALVARAVATETPPQALLLAGPGGVGKTTLALDLAAGLLCEAPPRARPCRACSACRRVAHGNHPDLHRLVPEGPGRQIRIGRRDSPETGTVRRLLHDLALAPAEGRVRAVVVEEAHRLNPDAQNALLKALEEPPPGTCIVLCADNEDLLLPTVRSRCVRVRCGPVPAEETAALLVERGLADPSRAAMLASLAGGRPGRAIALAHAPEAVLLRDRLVRQLLDLTRATPAARLAVASEILSAADDLETQLDRSLAALLEPSPEGDPDRTGSTRSRSAHIRPRRPAARPDADAEERTADPNERSAGAASASSRRARMAPSERRRALLALCELWQDLARDLALVVRGARRGVRQRDLLDELAAAASDLDPNSLTAFLLALDRLMVLADANANPELVLDVLLLRWPHPAVAA